MPNNTGAAYYRREGVPQLRCVASSPQEILMITQPNPQLEARPATPDVQHRHPLHLPGRPHLRPVPQSTRDTGTRPLNIALVGLQLLLGYEWLLAGGDKFLLGAFPAQLGGLLSASVHGGHLVGFFVAILQGLVAPNAGLFLAAASVVLVVGQLVQWRPSR